MIYKFSEKSRERVIIRLKSFVKKSSQRGGLVQSPLFYWLKKRKTLKNTGVKNNFGTFLRKSIDI